LIVDRTASPFFQGKGRQFSEKKGKIQIKKLVSFQVVKNKNTASRPVGEIAAMAKA
jgi:hypothetical protein